VVEVLGGVVRAAAQWQALCGPTMPMTVLAPQRPVTIVRFGPESFMRDLIEHGIVWMNVAGHFATLTSDQQRGDPEEGLTRRYSQIGTQTTFHIPNQPPLQLPLAGPLRIWNNADRQRAIYSVFAVPDLRERVDERCLELGRHVVFFHDGMEFARRVCAAASSRGHELAFGPVRYVSDRYSGEMTIFTKPDKFQHQNEWRFVTREPVCGGRMILTLGSLHDIAALVSL
jgi:hypothetical protein